MLIMGESGVLTEFNLQQLIKDSCNLLKFMSALD